MLTVNVMIIEQPPVTAIFRWRARLACESTVMDPISGTTLMTGRFSKSEFHNMHQKVPHKFLARF